jgi:hypothetical protein
LGDSISIRCKWRLDREMQNRSEETSVAPELFKASRTQDGAVMTTSRKLWIAGIVLTSAVSYLAYAGARQGWVYYVSVDQFI